MFIDSTRNFKQSLIAIGSPDGETGKRTAEALKKFLTEIEVNSALMHRQVMKNEHNYIEPIESDGFLGPIVDDLYFFNRAVRILKNSRPEFGIIDFTPVEALSKSPSGFRPLFPIVPESMDYVVHVIPANHSDRASYLAMADKFVLSPRTGVIEFTQEGLEDSVAEAIAHLFTTGLRLKEVNATYREI